MEIGGRGNYIGLGTGPILRASYCGIDIWAVDAAAS